MSRFQNHNALKDDATAAVKKLFTDFDLNPNDIFRNIMRAALDAAFEESANLIGNTPHDAWCETGDVCRETLKQWNKKMTAEAVIAMAMDFDDEDDNEPTK